MVACPRPRASGNAHAPVPFGTQSDVRATGESSMANPLIEAFDRRPGAIVGAPGAERTRRGTELGVDRILDQRYKILEPIGTGGSSQVYLAQDTALRRAV